VIDLAVELAADPAEAFDAVAAAEGRTTTRPWRSPRGLRGSVTCANAVRN
jgi:hypothetical protein